MGKQSVLILGSNGRVGRALVDAFAAAGWRVIAQVRRAPVLALPVGAEPLVCDALDTARLIAAADGADVIINALNPDYTRWEELLPPLSASVLAVAKASGARLILAGNVYNFGRDLPAVLREDTPECGNTPKARLRIEMEAAMRAARTEGVKSAVIRAGDFFGGGPGSWIDLAIAKDLQKGKIVYPGPTGLAHAWAYLPDLARVFVAVAERRAALADFEVLNFAGHTLSGAELHTAFERVMGHRLALRSMPWWVMRLISPVVPMVRAIVEMRYLWQRPHQLDETKLQALIGRVPKTPIDLALATALETLKERARVAPAHAPRQPASASR